MDSMFWNSAVITIHQGELLFIFHLTVFSRPLHSHTHTLCSFSQLFVINFHRYWSLEVVPLGKEILPPPPTNSPVSSQCHIHCALGNERNPTGFVSDSLSVLLMSASDWCIRSLVHKHPHQRHKYAGLIFLLDTQMLPYTVDRHLIIGSLLLEISPFRAHVKKLIKGCPWRLCFIH